MIHALDKLKTIREIAREDSLNAPAIDHVLRGVILGIARQIEWQLDPNDRWDGSLANIDGIDKDGRQSVTIPGRTGYTFVDGDFYDIKRYREQASLLTQVIERVCGESTGTNALRILEQTQHGSRRAIFEFTPWPIIGSDKNSDEECVLRRVEPATPVMIDVLRSISGAGDIAPTAHYVRWRINNRRVVPDFPDEAAIQQMTFVRFPNANKAERLPDIVAKIQEKFRMAAQVA